MGLDDRECMTRVMYFESNRSSEDGMLAVGTTVMNRLESPKYPKTVCGVVGQRNQFADGVLSKPMNPRLAARVAQVADAVLAGARHPQVGSAMFFHTAGYTFPYRNMHYVAVAGGNAFYEKVSVPVDAPPAPPADPPRVTAVADAPVFPPTEAPPLVEAESARSSPQSIDDILTADSGSAEPRSRLTTAATDDESGLY